MPLPAYIPEQYIDDPVLRLDMLREIAALDSDDAVEHTVADLKDRFGPLPDVVHNLLTVIRLKNLASGIGLERLNYDRLAGAFTLKFFEDEPDWYKRAPLIDSRFSPGREQGSMLLEMEFSAEHTPSELLDTLESLTSARPA
jgi:transcription-repair coupling factor (superfamily II helicase)